jgi:plasmid maintenance system antidote protein VapI
MDESELAKDEKVQAWVELQAAKRQRMDEENAKQRAEREKYSDRCAITDRVADTFITLVVDAVERSEKKHGVELTEVMFYAASRKLYLKIKALTEEVDVTPLTFEELAEGKRLMDAFENEVDADEEEE